MPRELSAPQPQLFKCPLGHFWFEIQGFGEFESLFMKNYLFIHTFELLTFLGYINIFTLMKTSLYQYPTQKTFELVKRLVLQQQSTPLDIIIQCGCGVWAR